MQHTVLKQLSEENTPAYVLDVECLKEKVLNIKQYLQRRTKVELCYAMKANPFLIETLDALVDKFEVCSPGELAICMDRGIAPNKIVLSGVNKGYDDTLIAMKYGVEIFTAESWKHIKLIQKCAKETNRKVNVLVRLTSGNQFGVDKMVIREMIEQRADFPNLQICGIHFYSGTQKKVEKLEAEIKELLAFFEELERDYRIKIERLEYGPGLAINYFKDNDDADAKLQKCAEELSKVDEKIQLTIELGRFIAADCGSYVTKVVDVKCNMEQTFCIVDGGINHVNYYGQVGGVKTPPISYYRKKDDEYIEADAGEQENTEESLCICGSLCTTADVLVKKMAIKEAKVGDMLVFKRIGAYSITEGIYLFLSRKMPKVYLLENDKLKLLRGDCETYEWNSVMK